MRCLTNLDMSQNELQNAVFHNSYEAPPNPKVGQFYVDISGDEPVLNWWNGNKWVPLGESTPENYPTSILPSINISLSSSSKLIEVGESISIEYETSFNGGSYTYGPDTGVKVTSLRVYDNSVPHKESSTPFGRLDNIIVPEGTEYRITVEADYSQGTIPLTDKGNPYPTAQILAGTATDVIIPDLSSVGGYRKYFYGASTDLEDIDSNYIRSLIHSESPLSAGSTFDLPIEEGSNRVIVAFPQELGLNFKKVIDTGAFNINVYDIFKKVTIDVEGANGYKAIPYDVYVYEPDVSLGENTYVVTIS